MSAIERGLSKLAHGRLRLQKLRHRGRFRHGGGGGACGCGSFTFMAGIGCELALLTLRLLHSAAFTHSLGSTQDHAQKS